MDKVRLSLEDLEVESFSTSHEPGPALGTVRGAMNMQNPQDPSNGFCGPNDSAYCDTMQCTAGCPPPNGGGGPIPVTDFCITYTGACTCAGTCEASCNGTCVGTCAFSCNGTCPYPACQIPGIA